MIKNIFCCLFICTMPFGFLFCNGKKTDDKFFNLNFFEIVDEKPTHWVFSKNGYNVFLENGSGIVMLDSLGLEDDFGMALNQIPIELVRGKTVKISCTIQSVDFQRGLKIGLWCGVDNPNGPTSFSDRTREIHLKSFYQNDSIEMKVDNTAQSFYFGAIAKGKGGVGFGYFSVSIDGVKYDDTQSQELTDKQKAWLKKNIHILKTTNPDETDNTDLEILDDLVGDTQVVALGEITHGAKEVFELKNRMIRYLVQNRGYDVFSMEENEPECYAINQNVLVNGEDNIEEQMKRYFIWPWQTKQVEAMLKWMKNYKQGGGKIQFTGFDKQINQGIFRMLTDMFTEEHPQYLLPLDSIKSETMVFMQNAMMNGFKPDSTMKNNIEESIDRLSLMTDKEQWKNKEFLDLNLKILNQSLDIQERDHYMADNFLDIIDKNNQSKFIIWAHNTHIGKTKKWLGEYLSKALGKDYLKIGFVIDNGEYTAWDNAGGVKTFKVQPAFLGTLDYYLNSIDIPLFIMDLRKVRADNSKEAEWIKGRILERKTGSGYIENEFAPFDINKYDILIFIKHVNASELIPR